jgi:hypothetical protein
MRLRYVLTVSLFTVFMIPFIKNVNTADALGKYGCDSPLLGTMLQINCLRTKLDTTTYGLTVPKGNDGLGNYQCGNKQGNTMKRQHINCLRLLLDQHGGNLAAGSLGGNSGDPCMKAQNPMTCMFERAKGVIKQKGVTEEDSGDPCMKAQNPMSCMIERAKGVIQQKGSPEGDS